MRRSPPNCGWLRPTPSSSCATVRPAAVITANPVVQCRPILPVGEDLRMGSILTTKTTGTTTINPTKTPAPWAWSSILPPEPLRIPLLQTSRYWVICLATRGVGGTGHDQRADLIFSKARLDENLHGILATGKRT
jgi:hypothetical protein